MRLLTLVITMSAFAFAIARGQFRKRPLEGVEVETITVDTRERTYRVYVPPGVDEPMPLVFVLHGGGAGERAAPALIGYTGFNKIALREKFIAAYPVGVDGNWNDGRGVEFIRAQKEKVDDVKFLRRVVDDIAKTYPVDRTRVFSTGISNGAFMSHRLAAEASDLVTGIAPVVGGMSPAVGEAFAPAHPVSLFLIQGDADPLVPYEGGGVGLNPRRHRGKALPTEGTLAKYLTHLRIEAEPKVKTLPNSDPRDGTTTEARVYPPAKSGAKVQFYLVKGGGHTWPGAKDYLTERLVGKTARDFDAAEAIWEFFKSCPPRKRD